MTLVDRFDELKAGITGRWRLSPPDREGCRPLVRDADRLDETVLLLAEDRTGHLATDEPSADLIGEWFVLWCGGIRLTRDEDKARTMNFYYHDFMGRLMVASDLTCHFHPHERGDSGEPT